MALSLPQGGNAALVQVDPTAQTVFIGLNWELPVTTPPVEIDASLFLLNASGVVRDDRDFVFYNQETDASGAVYRIPVVEQTPDDRDGFIVSLPTLPDDVQRLAFCLTLDTANAPNTTFGAVSWIQARAVNSASGQELIRYRSSGELGAETAIIVAELYRHRESWKFRAIGQGFAGGLAALATHFGVLITDPESPSAQAATADQAPPSAPLLLDKGSTDGEGKRRRRTTQELIAGQVETIKTRYRAMQPLLKRVIQDNANESQSRLLLDRILQDVLGYALHEIKTEQKIQGRSADYVIAPDGVDALVIEAKRIGAPLRDKQIFQATSYAAYAGIRWALLTNVVTWQLYRVATEDKVQADLVFSLDLQNGLDNDSAYRLLLLSKTGITRCELLEKLWQKKVALSADSLMTTILNEEVLNKIRSVLIRERGCALTTQEIQDAIERELLR